MSVGVEVVEGREDHPESLGVMVTRARRSGCVGSGSSRCVKLARTLFDPFKVDVPR